MSATKRQIDAAVYRQYPDVRGGDLAIFRSGMRIAAKHLVPSDHVIVPRAYLDALTALLDAGCSVGVADGRWAAEKFWQNAENERDAAREEMGL